MISAIIRSHIPIDSIKMPPRKANSNATNPYTPPIRQVDQIGATVSIIDTNQNSTDDIPGTKSVKALNISVSGLTPA